MGRKTSNEHTFCRLPAVDTIQNMGVQLCYSCVIRFQSMVYYILIYNVLVRKLCQRLQQWNRPVFGRVISVRYLDAVGSFNLYLSIGSTTGMLRYIRQTRLTVRFPPIPQPDETTERISSQISTNLINLLNSKTSKHTIVIMRVFTSQMRVWCTFVCNFLHSRPTPMLKMQHC